MASYQGCMHVEQQLLLYPALSPSIPLYLALSRSISLHLELHPGTRRGALWHSHLSTAAGKVKACDTACKGSVPG
jgi:hypothetical protein